jgi:hypothetical protein
MASLTLTSPATARLLTPLEHASTIRALVASAWAVLARAVSRSKVNRSSFVSTNSAFGLPVRAIATSIVMG